MARFLRALSVAALAAGSTVITAHAGADGNIDLSSSPNPSIAGDTVTITAPSNTCFNGEGWIEISDGSSTLGVMRGQENGPFIFTTAELSVGTHTITAVCNMVLPYHIDITGTLQQVVEPQPAPPPPPPDANPPPSADAAPTAVNSSSPTSPASGARTLVGFITQPRGVAAAVLIALAILAGVVYRQRRLGR